jgi:DNA-binding CsgD family transcriptional regulator
MSKSQELRLADVRAIFRLVGDCRDLGSDVFAWNQVLTQSANRLFNTVMANSFLYSIDPVKVLAEPQILADSWVDEATRAKWYNLHVNKHYSVAPTIIQFVQPYTEITVTRRQELMTNAAWANAWERNEARASCGQDEFIYAAVPLKEPVGRYFAMSFNRAIGEPAFRPYEQRHIRLLLEELQHLFSTRLHLSYGGLPMTLRLRLQQILLSLQTGDSEKQIALKLGLSKHTVHDYVRELYAHYGVQSRAALLSICRIATPSREAGSPS